MRLILLSEFLTIFSIWSASRKHSQSSNSENFILRLMKLFYAESQAGLSGRICTVSTCRWQNSGPKLWNTDYTYS